jgi:hypothetical protein
MIGAFFEGEDEGLGTDPEYRAGGADTFAQKTADVEKAG